MSFIDDKFDDWLMEDALGYHDNDQYEYDDSFILAERQKPSCIGGIDWRYEKGGVFCDD